MALGSGEVSAENQEAVSRVVGDLLITARACLSKSVVLKRIGPSASRKVHRGHQSEYLGANAGLTADPLGLDGVCEIDAIEKPNHTPNAVMNLLAGLACDLDE